MSTPPRRRRDVPMTLTRVPDLFLDGFALIRAPFAFGATILLDRRTYRYTSWCNLICVSCALLHAIPEGPELARCASDCGVESAAEGAAVLWMTARSSRIAGAHPLSRTTLKASSGAAAGGRLDPSPASGGSFGPVTRPRGRTSAAMQDAKPVDRRRGVHARGVSRVRLASTDVNAARREYHGDTDAFRQLVYLTSARRGRWASGDLRSLPLIRLGICSFGGTRR